MPHAPVSVVIPAYNSAAWLGEAISSVLAQTLPPVQIIVVDDGSTDKTPEVARRFGRQIEYVRQPNLGVSAARNTGVGCAREEYIAFLDADDVWHPRKLQVQIQFMERSPQCVLLGTRSFAWPATAMASVAADEVRSTPIAWEDLVVKNRLVTSSVIARRDAIHVAGQFDVNLQGPEDRDLWLRLARLGEVANIELQLTGYRSVAGSVSRHPDRCYAGMRRIIEKLDEQGLFSDRWLLRRKALSYIENSCAWIYSASGGHSTAIAMILKSMLIYPLPYRRSEVTTSMERPKRLILNLLRLMKLKANPDRQSSVEPAPVQPNNAETLYV